jgi:peptide/nickel transport system substrate-binding protein
VRTVNASDFEYSLNRLLMKSRFSRRLGFTKRRKLQSENDSIFEIKLIKPFPAFLGLMTMKYASVVPKEIVSHYGSDFRSHPIGTGPFQLKLWEENVNWSYAKTLYFMKRRERKCTALSRSCCHYLFYLSKVVFCNLYKEN